MGKVIDGNNATAVFCKLNVDGNILFFFPVVFMRQAELTGELKCAGAYWFDWEIFVAGWQRNGQQRDKKKRTPTWPEYAFVCIGRLIITLVLATMYNVDDDEDCDDESDPAECEEDDKNLERVLRAD